MPLTSEAVDEYVASIRGVRQVLIRNVDAMWRLLPSDPEDARDVLLRAFPTLIAEHGELASLAAVDFYDLVRGATDFAAELAPATPTEQVHAATRWALTPLFSSDPDDAGALGRVKAVADRLTINQAHETVWRNGTNDPREPRFARVPVGNTCAWCRALASRGAIYRSEVSAKFRRSHDDCDCKVSPVFDDEPLPYDQDALYREYLAARDAAGSGSLSDITAAMRKQSGSH